jgi:membrane dipeptidase
MFIFDGHLDLAMNALAYGRDQTLQLHALRQREAGHAFDDHRGVAMVTLEQMRRGGVRACLATLFVRASRGAALAQMQRRSDSDHASHSVAYAMAHGQLAYYRLLESQGQISLVSDAAQLELALARPDGPIACIVLMEGADPILEPNQVAAWRAAGVRVVSLTHTEATDYAGGNATELPLTSRGVELLDAMAAAGMLLDVSHLSDASLFAALDAFGGAVLASHSNCRALCPGHRQITDEQIRLIAQRGGVIGVVMHNGMLCPGAAPRSEVSLQHVAMHIDHICQLTGRIAHAAIGSDLDGGFGLDRTPTGLDSIADLHAVASPLGDRGFSDADIAAVLGGNWLSFYAAHL